MAPASVKRAAFALPPNKATKCLKKTSSKIRSGANANPVQMNMSSGSFDAAMPPAIAPKAAATPAPKPAAPAAKQTAAQAEHVPKAAAPTGPPDQPPPADKTPPAFIATLQAAIPDAVKAISYWVGDWTIIVAPEAIIEVAQHLRYAPDAAFDLCSDLTATDWPPRPARFDVVYCLYSTRHRHRLLGRSEAAGRLRWVG